MRRRNSAVLRPRKTKSAKCGFKDNSNGRLSFSMESPPAEAYLKPSLDHLRILICCARVTVRNGDAPPLEQVSLGDFRMAEQVSKCCRKGTGCCRGKVFENLSAISFSSMFLKRFVREEAQRPAAFRFLPRGSSTESISSPSRQILSNQIQDRAMVSPKCGFRTI